MRGESANSANNQTSSPCNLLQHSNKIPAKDLFDFLTSITSLHKGLGQICNSSAVFQILDGYACAVPIRTDANVFRANKRNGMIDMLAKCFQRNFRNALHAARVEISHVLRSFHSGYAG